MQRMPRRAAGCCAGRDAGCCSGCGARTGCSACSGYSACGGALPRVGCRRLPSPVAGVGGNDAHPRPTPACPLINPGRLLIAPPHRRANEGERRRQPPRRELRVPKGGWGWGGVERGCPIPVAVGGWVGSGGPPCPTAGCAAATLSQAPGATRGPSPRQHVTGGRGARPLVPRSGRGAGGRSTHGVLGGGGGCRSDGCCGWEPGAGGRAALGGLGHRCHRR